MKALHDNESSFGESSTYDPPPAPPPYLSPAGTIMERGNPFHVDIPALRDDESSFGESSTYEPPPAQTSPDSAVVPQINWDALQGPPPAPPAKGTSKQKSPTKSVLLLYF
ncbi:hypothetical protein AGOR_G00091250 [Albula goreensis]|uniref:Uncharacterized protein n=1 Tax=Albula goreensis TaxID=1534307 RepID=A0A8T3DI44_9TELE|nr:hypothetical protein AGOR_G00091250 [Albula goreensis]